MNGGIQRFEPYGPPRTSMAAAVRDLDVTVASETALRRENHRLRAEKAEALCAAEAERAESARLRAQNLELSQQLEWEKSHVGS